MSDGGSVLPGPFQNVAWAFLGNSRIWSNCDSYIFSIWLRSSSTVSFTIGERQRHPDVVEVAGNNEVCPLRVVSRLLQGAAQAASLIVLIDPYAEVERLVGSLEVQEQHRVVTPIVRDGDEHAWPQRP